MSSGLPLWFERAVERLGLAGVKPPVGLTPRLLLLAVSFALAAELFILIPSLASYHEGRLLERVRAAELASLVVDAAPEGGVTDAMAAQLLNGAGVISVTVQSGGIKRLLLNPNLQRAPDTVDLRRSDPVGWLTRPFAALLSSDKRLVRVIAEPTFRDGDYVEIVTPNPPLRRELGAYLLGLLGVTLFIAAVAGSLLYLALDRFLVRPMQTITRAMERFRADPDDPRARVRPSGRLDEIGRAEAELDQMQGEIRAALASRARLAALGEAVAKINHDLRNMLSSAQIASERLAMSGDPQVAQAMPRLERALDRAINLASDVLTYGKSEEAPPRAAPIGLRPALDAAAEDAGLTAAGVRLDNKVKATDAVLADPEQLHRILVNLMRNAREAINEDGRAKGRVRAALEHSDGLAILRLSDDGPGVPDRAREALFLPFAGSSRKGGTGLGLAISRELALAHGGDLRLAQSGPRGAVFELLLPDQPAPAQPLARSRAPRPRAADPRRLPRPRRQR